MADFFKAIVLGAVQGLTEFFPVSSSGHLILVEKLLAFESGGLAFDLSLHVGTLAAAVIALRKEIIALLRTPKKIIWLAIASVPAAVVGFTLSPIVEKYFFSTITLPTFFLLTAILLLLGENARQKGKPVDGKCAAFMGLSQALAVIPGLSRSGTTIACGMLFSYERREVTTFSFLMSIPVICGGILSVLIKGQLKFSAPLIMGTVTSLVFGLVAVRFTYKAIGKFKYFCIYLIVLSAVTTILNITGAL